MTDFLIRLFDPAIGFCRHRPLFGWAMSLVFGTGLGFFFGGAWGWLLFATALIITSWRTKTLSVSVLLWLCCFALAGWRGACLHDRNAVVLEKLRSYQESGENLRIKVTVSNDRQVIQRKRGGPYCRFSVDDAWLDDGTEVHGTNLLVYFYDRTGNFPKTGETWWLNAKLRANSNLHRLSLSARGDVARHLPQEDQHDSLQYRLSNFRNRLATHLALGVSDAEALLTQTMVLGTRSRLPFAVRQRYADAGIIHIFAISGLHVGIIAGLLIWFLAWIGVRLRTRIIIIMPALLGYLLLTGVPPSAARACLMAILFCFAPTLYRRGDGASALFATAIIVLILEPAWVANAGALLSFCVMGGLFLFTKPFSYFINRLFHSLPRRSILGELPTEQSWTVTLRQRLAVLLGLSFAAWIAALPLCLFFFGRVSIAGILLNLFVPSLTIIIVWCACFSALFGFCLPILSILLNRLNAALLSFIDFLSERALTLPFAVYELEHTPGVTFSLIMGCGIILTGMWLNLLERRLRMQDPFDPEVFRFLPGNDPINS